MAQPAANTMSSSTANWCPSGKPGWAQWSFRFGNEEFFVMARKSRACAEAYIGTPHKQARRLTPPWRKRTVSGRKLVAAEHFLQKVRGPFDRIGANGRFLFGQIVKNPGHALFD